MSGGLLGVYPSFPVYVGDWFGSRAVATMTLEQQGAYMRLLLHAWPTSPENLKTPCTLPDDDAELAQLSGMGLDLWSRAGGKVRAQFPSIGDGHLRNAKQYAVWQSMLERSQARSGAGRKGMASRWNTEGDEEAGAAPPPPPAEPSASELAFREAWALMLTLKRPNNPKKLARKAWDARVNAGCDPAELLEGTRRYVAYCTATGKVGTETVMQGATFYGPNERWAEEFAVPTASVAPGAALDKARERWRFYVAENLTDTTGDVRSRLAELVKRGEWPSMEAAETELRKVRPWDISRTVRGDGERAVREVAKRLGVAA